MPFLHRVGVVGAMTVLVVAPVAAQPPVARVPGMWVGAPIEEYVRLLQLSATSPLSSEMIRPSERLTRWTPNEAQQWRAPWSHLYAMDSLAADTGYVRLKAFYPVIQTTYNSAVPYGMNDGAMWAGRGISAQITGGVNARLGRLTVQLAPSFTWSENRGFTTSPLFFAAPTSSPYADQFLSARIDRPQRFGDQSFGRGNFGQTRVELQIAGAKIGVSTENMWWGPGIDNGLLITNNAAGFPHVYVGTTHPTDVWLGKLEVLYSVGTLSQSKFWRIATDTFPRDRWVNSLAIAFEPKGAPGLYLGAGRVFMAYQRYNPITLRELLSIAQTFKKEALVDPTAPGGTDTRDQLAALWFRWVVPEIGFETYGEYGRGDHNWDLRDIVLEPDHSRAYLLGARKVFRAGHGLLSVRTEVADLGAARTAQNRGAGFWYAHTVVQQGFTQLGQVIGAGIGTGSDQQTLAVDWFFTRGRLGLILQRHRNDSDSFYRQPFPSGQAFRYHDVYFSSGARMTYFWGPVETDVLYSLQYEFNRYTTLRNDLRNHRLEVRSQVRLP